VDDEGPPPILFLEWVTSTERYRVTSREQRSHLVHNRRRSFNLCWFPECSPAQIVDHLASKVVIW